MKQKKRSSSKNYIISAFFILLFGISLSSLVIIYRQYTTISHQNLVLLKNVLNLIYEGISEPPVISEEEFKAFISEEGSPIYGELTFEGAAQLFKILKPTAHDVFYDLGSGLGKLVVQCYLETSFSKVVGIELSKSRYQQSLQALSRMKRVGMISSSRGIQIFHENIVHTNLEGATIIYICSTSYTDLLMSHIAQNIEKSKSIHTVVSLKIFSDLKGFSLDKEIKLSTSWNIYTPVYIYKRKLDHKKS